MISRKPKIIARPSAEPSPFGDERSSTYGLAIIFVFVLIVLFPALLLATEYHQRWEVESTIDELKVHHKARKIPGRSQNPREVVQEVYGWLLGHWALRSMMFQVADHAQISPLRLGFTGTLNVIRRAIPKFQRLEPEEIPFF